MNVPAWSPDDMPGAIAALVAKGESETVELKKSTSRTEEAAR